MPIAKTASRTHRPAAKAAKPEHAPRKVAQTFRLRSGLVKSVRKALGAKNDTEAVEMALDMIAFRNELISSVDKCYGIDISYPEEK